MHEFIQYLRKLIKEEFYGRLEVLMEKGKIVRIKKTESVKLGEEEVSSK